MKIEIYNNNRLIKKIKKKVVTPPNNNLDFSSIRSLTGNKNILDSLFEQTKKELIYG